MVLHFKVDYQQQLLWLLQVCTTFVCQRHIFGSFGITLQATTFEVGSLTMASVKFTQEAMVVYVYETCSIMCRVPRTRGNQHVRYFSLL
jgi:hypothetical protein